MHNPPPAYNLIGMQTQSPFPIHQSYQPMEEEQIMIMLDETD